MDLPLAAVVPAADNLTRVKQSSRITFTDECIGKFLPQLICANRHKMPNLT